MRRLRPSRLAVTAVAATLILAACGGGDNGDSTSDGDAASGDAASSDDSGEEVAAAPAAAAGVDLGGEALDPASDVETNLFPDLVVDDVVREKKVNLRNLVPSEKPVLLWMYAPH